MNLNTILNEFKIETRRLYGTRLKDIILYGSYARGEASSASDIDIMVVLKGDVIQGREIDRMIDLITELNLKYDAHLAVVPISGKEFQTTNSPLLLSVRREGIPA